MQTKTKMTFKNNWKITVYILKSSLEKMKRAEELAQQLKALVALPGPRFNLKHPHEGSQPTVILVPGDVMSSSGFYKHQAPLWYTDI